MGDGAHSVHEMKNFSERTLSTRKMHFVFSQIVIDKTMGMIAKKTKNSYKFLLVSQLQYCAMHSHRKIVYLVWRQAIVVSFFLFWFVVVVRFFRHARTARAAAAQ